MEAAYTSLYLWKAMAEKAGSFEVDKIQAAADGVTFEAPEGLVTVNGENNHITKTPRIGKINSNGLIDTVWSAPKAVEPDPFLTSYFEGCSESNLHVSASFAVTLHADGRFASRDEAARYTERLTTLTHLAAERG